MSETYLTRKTLVRRLKSNADQMAWDEFVHYYKGLIHSIIIKMGVDQMAWDDLSQRVMLKIWKSISTFNHNQEQGQFRSWITRITKNTVLSYLTSSQRSNSRNQLYQQESVKDFSEPEIDKVIDEEWECHISTLAFEKISKKVPPVAMEAFLASLRGDSVADISEKLNISEELFYTYKSRVKQKLMGEIKNLRELLE